MGFLIQSLKFNSEENTHSPVIPYGSLKKKDNKELISHPWGYNSIAGKAPPTNLMETLWHHLPPGAQASLV